MIKVNFERLGALYVQIRDAEVYRTVELVPDALMVDLDEGNNVVGIEALKPGTLHLIMKVLPISYRMTKEARELDFDNLAKRRQIQ